MRGHRLAGTIPATGQRVLEILNDPSSRYLKVSDVALQPDAEHSRPVRLAEMMVPKSGILVCVLAMDSHEAPEKRRFGFVEKRKRKAFVLVQTYQVQGILSIKGTADPVALLGQEFSEFFPVSEATVLDTVTNHSIPAKVALVNKSCVSALHVGEAV